MGINAKNFGIAGGILGAAIILITTLLATWTGYGTAFLNLMSSIYPGFTISVGGAFLGLIYGFVDCFIFFYLLGWIYNKLEK